MAKKKIPEITKSENEDMLARDVMSIINKKFKDTPNAAQFLSQANLVTDWLSTGCDALDILISNVPNGGIGYGIITEVSGKESSGKSLFAAHLLSNCQKDNGLAVLFDIEKALGRTNFYESFGLRPESLLYLDKVDVIEDVYAATESIIEKTVLSETKNPLAIVIDSVTSATTKTELELGYDKQGFNTTKAIVNSQAMRKLPSLIARRKIALILIQQLRVNPNPGFGGDPYIVPGGLAIGYTASTRLRVKAIGRIKGVINGVKGIVGERIEVTVVKSRFGPSRRKVVIDIYYNSGIDNYGTTLAILKEFGIFVTTREYYNFEFVNTDTGEIITKRFKDTEFKRKLEEDPMFKEVVYQKLCEILIMTYKKPDEEETVIDNITIEEFNEDEDF